MADLYLEPSIVYIPAQTRAKTTPIFRYKLELQNGRTFTHYRWIEQTGSNFAIRRVEVLEAAKDGNYEGFKKNELHGELQWTKGDIEHLNNKLPKGKALQREPLLPEKATDGTKGDLEKWLEFTEKAKQQHPNVDDTFNRVREIFVEIFEEHFASAESAILLKEWTKLEQHFKGLSIGRSQTECGFFMKGIKTAYDALGFYQQTYGGLRFSNFGLDELINYVKAERTAYPKSKLANNDFDTVPGFERTLGPSKKNDPHPEAPLAIPKLGPDFKGIPKEYLAIIQQTMRHWAEKNQKMPKPSNPKAPQLAPDKVINMPVGGKASDSLVVVHEYGFRGDGRPPMVVLNSGGLHPNAIRYYLTEKERDDFEDRRKKLEQQAVDTYSGHTMPHFDPYLHQNQYDAISVFLSVSRSPTVALRFIDTFSKGNGNIYLIRCLGAVDQEKTFKQVQYPGEQEISIAGGVDWADIIAVRPVVNGQPAAYCYVNLHNRWRAQDHVVQDCAVYRLMHFP